MERESYAHFQQPIDGYDSLRTSSPAEEAKRHRFSALADGIFIGIGMVLILLGVLMPITSYVMTIQGLMSIIGGIVVLAVGSVAELYHWARLC